jgi:DNA-binding transcriptional LysR family regulator
VTFARLHIIPAIDSFMSQHPDLKLEILLDDRNVDLLEEGIDVALRMGALDDSSMTARKLGESRRLVVGTPEYFKRAGIPSMPADLGAHRAVIYGSHGTEESWNFRQGDEKVTVALSGRMSVNAAEGIRSAVLASLGLTVVSEWMFAPELRSGTVRAVLEDWSLPPVGLWAVYPTGRMVSTKTRAFVEFVEETLASAL